MEKYKIVFITFYDMICYGTRILCSIAEKNGVESHLILLKKEVSYVPLIFGNKDKHATYQFYYNGLLRGSHYAVDPITKKEINILVETIKRINPSIICLSTRSFAYEFAKKIFPKVKTYCPDIPIIAGGWGPSLEPERFLEFSDYVAFGEGEKTISYICNKLINKKEFYDAPNLLYYKRKRLVKNSVGLALNEEEMNNCPFPNFDLKHKYLITDNKLRYGQEFYNEKVYDVFCARGCPLNCTYCLSGKYGLLYKLESGKTCSKYRLRDFDIVMKELHIAKLRGAKFIRFKDEVFPIKHDYIVKFIECYPKEIGLPFFAFLRPEFHSIDTIRKLKEAGLNVTMLGIQSGSDVIRRQIYNRKLPKTKVIKFAQTLDKLDIQFSYHFIYRNPFENEEHLSESLNFCFDLPYQNVFVFKLEVFQGSVLKKMIEQHKPTSLPIYIQDWYAILHTMSLKGPWYRTLSKWIKRYGLFRRIPSIMSVFFIFPLLDEYYQVLKNKFFLKATLHFSPKNK